MGRHAVRVLPAASPNARPEGQTVEFACTRQRIRSRKSYRRRQHSFVHGKRPGTVTCRHQAVSPRAHRASNTARSAQLATQNARASTQSASHLATSLLPASLLVVHNPRGRRHDDDTELREEKRVRRARFCRKSGPAGALKEHPACLAGRKHAADPVLDVVVANVVARAVGEGTAVRTAPPTSFRGPDGVCRTHLMQPHLLMRPLSSTTIFPARWSSMSSKSLMYPATGGASDRRLSDPRPVWRAARRKPPRRAGKPPGHIERLGTHRGAA